MQTKRATDPAPRLAASELHDDGDGKRRWVLVAEDDRDMLDLLVRTLRHDGYDVVKVGSGLELFDLLRKSNRRGELPILLVSDIRMPGLTGLEVLDKVRDWNLPVPVILITAFPDEETLAAVNLSGAATVLAKPFDMDDLRTAVSYLVARPHRAQALRGFSSRE